MSPSIQHFNNRFTFLLAITVAAVLLTGTWFALDFYRLARERFDAESITRSEHAAILVSNRLSFYRNILTDLAQDPRIVDLLESSDEAEVVGWAKRATGYLPGSLGTALVSPAGEIFGDPLSLRVGEACINDLREHIKADADLLDGPPVHRGVSGLEHFDLYQKITSASGEQAGLLMISFRLEPLQQMLDGLVSKGQRYRLLQRDGQEIVSAALHFDAEDTASFRTPLAGTDWILEYSLPHRSNSGATSTMTLVAVGLLILLAAAVLHVNQSWLGRITRDLQKIHQALLDVGNGKTADSPEAAELEETALLLAEIEAVSSQLAYTDDANTAASQRDPLTGLYNRRYFEVLLTHELLQSDRVPPAFLALIELNEFPEITEEYGHATGDALLQTSARFLLRHVRRSDTVARLDHNRFALLLQNTTTAAVEAWLRHLVAAFGKLEQPQCQRTGEALRCTVSIGATPLDRAQHGTIAHAVEHAVEMMTLARKDGDNTVRVQHRLARRRPAGSQRAMGNTPRRPGATGGPHG